MDRNVHEHLTRAWAREVGLGLEQAAEAARWDWQVDVAWPGSAWRNRRFHHRTFGARGLAAAYLSDAIRLRSVPHLGVALHLEQDSVGHGLLGTFVHWRGIDRWEKRSPRVRARLERSSKAMLRRFVAEARDDEAPTEASSLLLPAMPMRDRAGGATRL